PGEPCDAGGYRLRSGTGHGPGTGYDQGMPLLAQVNCVLISVNTRLRSGPKRGCSTSHKRSAHPALPGGCVEDPLALILHHYKSWPGNTPPATSSLHLITDLQL